MPPLDVGFQLTYLSAARIDERRDLRLQQVQRPAKRVAERLAPQEIRHNGQAQFVEVADEFLRVGEVGDLVRAAGDVAEVGAREGVDLARVAAHGDDLGDHGGHLYEVLGEGYGAVVVDGAEGTAVPWFYLVSGCF